MERNTVFSKNQINVFETKFYNSVRPFLIICQCFGCAPIHLSFETLRNLPKSNLSRRELLKSILHFVWFSILLVCITTSTYFQYSEFDTANIPFIARILYLGEYISGIFNSSLIVLGCHYQRE